MPTPRKQHSADVTDVPPRWRLKLIGVGGAGGNTIAHIAAAIAATERHPLIGVDLIALDPDLQALRSLTGVETLPIGVAVTHGLGCGGDIELGQRAAQQDAERLEALAQNTDLVFLVAGLGGGSGAGATPVVARAAKSQGALVIAFAFLPFGFEGERRRQQARAGLETLRQQADAVVAIPNDKLFKLAGDQATALQAFQAANDLCATGVQAFWQLLSRKGLVNVDFAALRNALGGRRSDGLFGIGTGSGEHKVRDAVQQALNHPLLEGADALARTETVLVSLLGGPDLTLNDVQRAVEPIARAAAGAEIIFGAAVDEAHSQRLTLTVVAAGPPTPRRHPPPATVRSLTQGHAPSRVAATPVAAGSSGPKPAVPVKKATVPRQENLPLQTGITGRFDDCESTIYEGEDLDVPTFLRRGVHWRR